MTRPEEIAYRSLLVRAVVARDQRRRSALVREAVTFGLLGGGMAGLFVLTLTALRALGWIAP